MSMPPDRVASLVENLDALTVGSWNETATSQNYGQSVMLTLSFIDPQALPDYYTSMHPDTAAGLRIKFGADFSAGSAFTEAQEQAALAAFDAWAKFADISRAGMQTDGSQTITFASLPFGGQAAGAEANTLTRTVASPQVATPLVGDVWLNSNSRFVLSGDFSAGSVNFETLLHEMGHALGLKHPVEQDSGGGDEGPMFSDSRWNSTRYTVMSYRRLRSTIAVPSAPMLLDIAAIQRLYGANASTNVGNDIYRFELNNGWPVQAIWDAGGNDTVDGSDQARELLIDLNPGGESHGAGFFGGRGAEIHIAFAPIGPDGAQLDQRFVDNYIENAEGGSNNDKITGNQGNNVLRGNAGNDVIFGERDADKGNSTFAASDDQLIGGQDNDKLYGGRGFDTYVYNAGDGRDTIFDLDGQGQLQINGVVLSARTSRMTCDRDHLASVPGARKSTVLKSSSS